MNGSNLAALLSLLTILVVLPYKNARAFPSPMTPDGQARQSKAWQLQHVAAAALDAGKLVEAESDARESLTTDPTVHGSEVILAASLALQGRDQEAMKLYANMVPGFSSSTDVMMPYALHLLKHGTYAGALAAYNSALPSVQMPLVHGRELFADESDFSINDPDPKGLEANIRISLGFDGINRGHWAPHFHPEDDLEQYKKALALEPDSPLANLAYQGSIQ